MVHVKWSSHVSVCVTVHFMVSRRCLLLSPKLPWDTMVGTSCCSTHDDRSIAATTVHTDMQQILKVN